jgi:CBS domain-containing protein
MTHGSSPRPGGPLRGAADIARLAPGLGEDAALLPHDIAGARDRDALAAIFGRIRRMALAGVEAGAPTLALGLLIGDQNDRILARAARIVAEGMPRPPTGFCLLVLGSEGRREQFFATDQDNALIVAAGDGPDARDGGDALAAFCAAFIATLAAIGFPPCENRVMIDNPEWRKTLADWMERVDDVVREPDAPGILMLSLLADARPVAGDAALGDALAAHLRRRVADSPVTLGYMAREALRFAPPLGFFKNLVVERSGPDKGGLDVKKGGIFAMVQGLRTLALEHGLAVTGTAERLAALAEKGVFSEARATRLAAAYEFLQTLRVRFQALAIRRGRPPGNAVFPDALDASDCDRLKHSLREVADFQELVHTRYGLHLFP